MPTLLLAFVVLFPSAGPDIQTSPAAQTRPVTGPHLGAIVQLTVDGDGGEPYWSFDGTKILFQAKRGDQKFDQIYMMNAEDRKSTRLNSSHIQKSRMPSSA